MPSGINMTSAYQPTGVNARDVRIDFFRGVALLMILVDHVGGDPISKFTYQKLGFSDAAEIFVFLSGTSCGIVYSRILARRRWVGFTKAITKRAALIYAYYLCSSIATVLLITTAADSIINASASGNSYLVMREDLISTIWSTIFLRSPPDLPGILVLYLLLTLIVMPLFFIGAARNAPLTLAASGCIWIVAQIYPELGPGLADHSYFNVLAWQFLFTIGLLVGANYNADWSKLRSTQMFRWLLVVAWTIVIFCLLYRLTLFVGRSLPLDLGWLRIADTQLVQMKENLSLVRLSHFLSVALLVGTYIASNSAILKWAGATAMIRVGAHSLEMFSLSAILSVALNIVVVVDRPSIAEKLILDGIAMVFMAMSAVLLSQFRTARPQVISTNRS